MTWIALFSTEAHKEFNKRKFVSTPGRHSRWPIADWRKGTVRKFPTSRAPPVKTCTIADDATEACERKIMNNLEKFFMAYKLHLFQNSEVGPQRKGTQRQKRSRCHFHLLRDSCVPCEQGVYETSTTHKVRILRTRTPRHLYELLQQMQFVSRRKTMKKPREVCMQVVCRTR